MKRSWQKIIEGQVLKRARKTILLGSYEFQAPRFYERQGYEILFVLDNFPDGYQFYTLIKRF